MVMPYGLTVFPMVLHLRKDSSEIPSMSALPGWLPDISFQTSVREVYFTARTSRWSVLFISLSLGLTPKKTYVRSFSVILTSLRQTIRMSFTISTVCRITCQ